MALSEEKLKKVREDAEDAFWAVVANSFPEAKKGDFPPDASFFFSEAISSAIRTWHEWNVSK